MRLKFYGTFLLNNTLLAIGFTAIYGDLCVHQLEKMEWIRARQLTMEPMTFTAATIAPPKLNCGCCDRSRISFRNRTISTIRAPKSERAAIAGVDDSSILKEATRNSVLPEAQVFPEKLSPV
jgi:hypothetical protein